MTDKKPSLNLERLYAYILSIGGAAGLIAMTWQASERVHMLKEPTSELACNINPIIDCTGVLGNQLSALFGFPNAFLGMVFFAILATSGLVLLSGGVFNRWFRHFVMAVSLILLLFSGWFFAVSLYVLGKICVFCVVGWIVSIPMFWYGLLYYLQDASGKIKDRTESFVAFGLKNHATVVVTVYIVMAALFLIRFSDFYFG